MILKMHDQKEFISDKADEIAYETYDVGFYDLDPECQDQVWALAEEAWIDYVAGLADHLKDTYDDIELGRRLGK